MPRYPDAEGWVLVVIAAGMGLLAAWLGDTHRFNENAVKVATYTVIIFASLAMALRRAWHRLRLWVDLVVLFLLHVAIVLPTVHLLDSHSIRLNWAMALPFLALELMLFLGLLWRRNVGDSSS